MSRIKNGLTKNEERQQLVRLYRDETGETDVDMHKVAIWAVNKGYPLPKPASAIEILAQQFTDAIRVEYRTDKTTGRAYRVNHAYVPEGQTAFWFDIDDPETTRKKMQISLINRREQMVSDGLQLTFDADHWNAMHPEEKPIKIPLDFTEDIDERKAGSS
jgi:hypothetical protein